MLIRLDRARSSLTRLDGQDGHRTPSETPPQASLEDARRLAQTYDDLWRVQRELVELCQRDADVSEPGVARTIRDREMILLEVQVSQFQQKSDFWKIRATELAGSGRDGGAH